jgi:REP element-mobilizing transposase RayT
VTVSFVRSLGSLRRERVFKKLREIFAYPNIKGFQVVQYSVQHDHVHLVVEARNKRTFSSGMRSLGIRAGLRLNKLFGQKTGKVIRDRYHRRDLFSATQVRRVLRYVLLNGQKHRSVRFGILDPCSSAGTFDGWLELFRLDEHDEPRSIGDPRHSLPPDARAAAPVKPWTQLLESDWRELGLLSPFEGLRWRPSPFVDLLLPSMGRMRN